MILKIYILYILFALNNLLLPISVMPLFKVHYNFTYEKFINAAIPFY